MYQEEEEECSILEVFGLEIEDANLIADEYIAQYLQLEV